MKKNHWQFSFILGVILVLCLSSVAMTQVLGKSNGTNSKSDPVIGEPFEIRADTIDEVNASAAYNPVDREFLVVWMNVRTGNNDIYAQRISENGGLLSWFYVADGEFPVLAYNQKNNTYLVVYMKWVGADFDIYARRVDYTGPLGAEFPLAFNLNEDEKNPRVAYNTHPTQDEFLVVWETRDTQLPTINSKIEGFRVAGTSGGGSGGGEVLGSRLPIAVTNDYNFGADVAYNLNMNEFFVVFTRSPSGGTGYNVHGRRVTWNGVLLPETTIDSSGNDQYWPKVAAYRLNQATPYLVVFNDRWNDTAGDVRGYLVNQQGEPVNLVNIATTPGMMEFEPSISQGESWGGYLVTWSETLTGIEEIYGRRVNHDGLLEPAFLISSNEPQQTGCDRRFPDNALGRNSGITVWYDNCGNRVSDDILGRLIGYRAYLPAGFR